MINLYEKERQAFEFRLFELGLIGNCEKEILQYSSCKKTFLIRFRGYELVIKNFSLEDHKFI